MGTNGSLEIIEEAVQRLEAIQAETGAIQVRLLQVLMDGQVDTWDEPAQQAMIRLEDVQRQVGEIQVQLLRQVPTCGQVGPAEPPRLAVGHPAPGVASEKGAPAPRTSGPAPELTDPRKWLEHKGFQVRSVRAASGLDGAASELACFLGEHFPALQGLYETIKRQIHTPSNPRYSTADLSPADFKIVMHFGVQLKVNSFLEEFRYIRNEGCVLFKPLGDGRVQNFFTGLWLERYAYSRVQRVYTRLLGDWQAEKVLLGPNVSLPGGSSAELDLLAGAANGQVIWLECKTGPWQNYVTRFKDINTKYLHQPPELAALVLLEEIPESARLSTSELSTLSAIHLPGLDAWLERAIYSTLHPA